LNWRFAVKGIQYDSSEWTVDIGWLRKGAGMIMNSAALGHN